MTKEDKEFYAGFAVAASFAANEQGHFNIDELFTSNSVTWDDLLDAGVSEFDLKRIRHALNSQEFKCIQRGGK